MRILLGVLAGLMVSSLAFATDVYSCVVTFSDVRRTVGTEIVLEINQDAKPIEVGISNKSLKINAVMEGYTNNKLPGNVMSIHSDDMSALFFENSEGRMKLNLTLDGFDVPVLDRRLVSAECEKIK